MPKSSKNRKHARKAKAKAKNKTKTKAGYVSASAQAMLASLEATITHNRAQLRQVLTNIVPTLILKSIQYKTFINSVSTSYEYNVKHIPIVLLRLIAQIRTVLERVNHLLRFHNEPAFLEAELARHGFSDIVTFIDLTLTNMEDIEDKMRRHTQNALDDYKGAQLGVEIRPAIRNNTNRNTDAIVRPPRTTRARALTRRTRSF
uniref:Uncharacterized protein n=1 Tax=viral metagenome TaxID=1070528 RepID=A0A6C0D5Y9_9ZZZZ